MVSERKQSVKAALKKVGKAVWSAFPWIFMWIGLACFFSLLFISADKSAERAKQLAALEAENAMYESANTRLDEEIDWLRSLVEQYYQGEAPDGQVQ
jgi:cell division protein FtsB